MSVGTSIAWSDATWNPIVGCTHAAYQPQQGHKVAHPGCDHCYADVFVSRPFGPAFTLHNQTSKNGKRAVHNGKPYPTVSSKGDDPGEWPEALRVQQNVGDL